MLSEEKVCGKKKEEKDMAFERTQAETGTQG